MEEELLKLKKSNNRKKAGLIIAIFVIVLMGLLLFIFFSDKKEEPKKEENKQQEKQEEKKEEKKDVNVQEVINVAENVDTKSKRVTFAVRAEGQDFYQHSKESLNDVTVDITADDYNKIISASVNNKDVKDLLFDFDNNPNTKEESYESIIGYEIYGKYVIFEVDIYAGHLIIYDTRDGSKKALDSFSTKYVHNYNEYESDATGLTIKTSECSMEQCRTEDDPKPATAKVIDGLTYESGYKYATYRIDYVNGKFGEPKLVKQY